MYKKRSNNKKVTKKGMQKCTKREQKLDAQKNQEKIFF